MSDAATYRMVWPIDDLRGPVLSLLLVAHPDLYDGLTAAGVELLDAPRWSLVAEVPVRPDMSIEPWNDPRPQRLMEELMPDVA